MTINFGEPHRSPDPRQRERRDVMRPFELSQTIRNGNAGSVHFLQENWRNLSSRADEPVLEIVPDSPPVPPGRNSSLSDADADPCARISFESHGPLTIR